MTYMGARYAHRTGYPVRLLPWCGDHLVYGECPVCRGVLPLWALAQPATLRRAADAPSTGGRR